MIRNIRGRFGLEDFHPLDLRFPGAAKLHFILNWKTEIVASNLQPWR